MMTKKKRSSPKIEVFFPQNQVNTKKKRKKVFTAIWDYLLPEFVGFIRAGWLLIVSSSSAKISMGGPLNLDGGTPNLDGGTLTLDGGTRPPYNLSTAYNCILCRDNGMTGMAVAQQNYHAVSSLNCDVVSIFLKVKQSRVLFFFFDVIIVTCERMRISQIIGIVLKFYLYFLGLMTLPSSPIFAPLNIRRQHFSPLHYSRYTAL